MNLSLSNFRYLDLDISNKYKTYKKTNTDSFWKKKAANSQLSDDWALLNHLISCFWIIWIAIVVFQLSAVILHDLFNADSALNFSGFKPIIGNHPNPSLGVSNRLQLIIMTFFGQF